MEWPHARTNCVLHEKINTFHSLSCLQCFSIILFFFFFSKLFSWHIPLLAIFKYISNKQAVVWSPCDYITFVSNWFAIARQWEMVIFCFFAGRLIIISKNSAAYIALSDRLVSLSTHFTYAQYTKWPNKTVVTTLTIKWARLLCNFNLAKAVPSIYH